MFEIVMWLACAFASGLLIGAFVAVGCYERAEQAALVATPGSFTVTGTPGSFTTSGTTIYGTGGMLVVGQADPDGPPGGSWKPMAGNALMEYVSLPFGTPVKFWQDGRTSVSTVGELEPASNVCGKWFRVLGKDTLSDVGLVEDAGPSGPRGGTDGWWNRGTLEGAERWYRLRHGTTVQCWRDGLGWVDTIPTSPSLKADRDRFWFRVPSKDTPA